MKHMDAPTCSQCVGKHRLYNSILPDKTGRPHLDDSDLPEALPAQLLGNNLAGAAAFVKQQNLGSLIYLL